MRIFMENQNTKFDTLLEHAWSILGKSAYDLKEIYKDYPVCLMEYIDKEVHEHIIVNSADYDFRKGCFKLPSCSLKIKETKTETCFYLFR